MRLIDSHCHFDFSVFNQNRTSVWQHCQSLGIQKLIIPGYSPERWDRTRSICDTHDGIFFALGVHPWALKDITESLPGSILQGNEVGDLLSHSKCIAIGECGLDKLIETKLDVQLDWTQFQIDCANSHQLPVIFHCVKAQNELIRLLLQNPPKAGGVVHAFTGSYEVGMKLIDCGLHLGVGGTITYERAQKTRDALTRIPLEHLVLETDAPDMPLAGKQGENNSPEYLPIIAEMLAELKRVDVHTVTKITSDNAEALFGI